VDGIRLPKPANIPFHSLLGNCQQQSQQQADRHDRPTANSAPQRDYAPPTTTVMSARPYLVQRWFSLRSAQPGKQHGIAEHRAQSTEPCAPSLWVVQTPVALRYDASTSGTGLTAPEILLVLVRDRTAGTHHLTRGEEPRPTSSRSFSRYTPRPALFGRPCSPVVFGARPPPPIMPTHPSSIFSAFHCNDGLSLPFFCSMLTALLSRDHPVRCLLASSAAPWYCSSSSPVLSSSLVWSRPWPWSSKHRLTTAPKISPHTLSVPLQPSHAFFYFLVPGLLKRHPRLFLLPMPYVS
jgi:hypothetical protein